ncbi:MAG TPA: AAA family ATPase [Thermoanaerobaculia bacterium]|nr:AAA family ATPase [Thermoanaerobaculia bacterium]
MRLLRLAIRHFRAVERFELEPLPVGVTVVAGPNEAGKTTLAESLDFLFDRRDDSRAQEVLEAQPVGRDVGPEVEAEIEAGGYRFRYRKRFVKDRETVLELLAPERRQWTGREAHERVVEILSETVDLDLWGALRVRQGRSEDQVKELGSKRSLLDALGGSLAGAREQALHLAAGEELERYYTPAQLRPKGELAAARQALAGAVAERDDLERQMSDREADAEACDRLERSLVERRGERQKADAAARQAEAELAEVERRAATVRQRRAELAEENQVADYLRELAGAAEEAVEVAARLAAARAELAAAEGPYDAAVEAVHRAEAAVQAAEERAEACRRHSQLARRREEHRSKVEALSERLGRAEQATARSAAAEARRTASPVDEQVVEELEAFQRDIDRLAARLEAASPQVTFSALRDQRVGIAGDGEVEEVDVATGERWTRKPEGRLTLTIPGVATFLVEPGGDVAAEVVLRRQLAERLRGRLAELGLADLAAARAAARDRAEAARERDAARALLDSLLAGGSLEELAARRASAVAEFESVAAAFTASTAAAGEAAAPGGRVSGGAADSAPATASPADVAAAEERATVAERAAAEARRQAEVARRALTEREQRRGRVVAACRALEARAEAADERHRRARQAAGRLAELDPPSSEATPSGDGRPSPAATSQLALFAGAPPPGDEAVPTGEAATPPEQGAPEPPDLETALVGAEERVAGATRALDEARRLLAEASPEAVATRAEAARQRRQRVDAALREAELEHRERVTRLEAAGEADLYERLQEARARHAHAEAVARTVERRAAAAERLHRVLGEEREEARRTYSEPLRQAIEEMGRPLYGDGFAVELDGELAIARRTLAGTTLRFDQLSSGAREQLALVARLACALLVDRQGHGVPLIIDDALGLTDRDRLRGMGEILSVAGASCQVIVLTSFPERYRHVDGARVVELAGRVGGAAEGR